MLKVSIEHLVIDGSAAKILDIIQWVHKHNKFNHAWGISFLPTDAGSMKPFLETNCAQIMNAVKAEWPDARIENIVK